MDIDIVYSRQLLCGNLGHLSLGDSASDFTSQRPSLGRTLSSEMCHCGFDRKYHFTRLPAANVCTEVWRGLSLSPCDREDTLSLPVKGSLRQRFPPPHPGQAPGPSVKLAVHY